MSQPQVQNNRSYLTSCLLKARTRAYDCKDNLGIVLDNAAYIQPALKSELSKELKQTIVTFRAKNGLSAIQMLWILISLLCNDLDRTIV